jgi:uncharacterized protein (DUF1015 family)
MADVRPFRALRYNPALDLSRAVCPPFDTISPEEQDDLYDRSGYNAVRIELAKADGGTRYENAARSLAAWLADGTLAPDEKPAFYVYRQTFSHGGDRCTRTLLFARLRVVPWADRVVLPHEQTFGAPKQDRIQNMRATRLNVSPVFLVYRASGEDVCKADDGTSVAHFQTTDGQTHELLRVDNGEAIAAVKAAFSDRVVYIADGHHRYETALAYRDEVQAAAAAGWTGEEAANFTLAAFVASDDPGLLVLPIHRITGAGDDWRDVRPRLEAMFEMTPVADDLEAAVSERNGNVAFGFSAANGGGSWLLTMKDAAAVERALPADRSAAWKGLDYSIANHAIMRACLGLTEDGMRDYSTVQFTEDAAEAQSAVRSGKAKYAVIMNPISVQKVLDLADAGERMPQKSTFFYPKVPTGLVFNRLAD